MFAALDKRSDEMTATEQTTTNSKTDLFATMTLFPLSLFRRRTLRLASFGSSRFCVKQVRAKQQRKEKRTTRMFGENDIVICDLLDSALDGTSFGTFASIQFLPPSRR